MYIPPEQIDHDFTLGLIQANLEAAKMAVFSSGNVYKNAIAAYHAEQTIEMSLKYLIERNAPDKWDDMTLKLCKTHNISKLISIVSDFDEDFIDRHMDIAKNSSVLSEFNAVRYGRRYIDEHTALNAIAMASRLYDELEQEFQRSYPNEKKNIRDENIRYEHMDALVLNADFETRQTAGSLRLATNVENRDSAKLQDELKQRREEVRKLRGALERTKGQLSDLKKQQKEADKGR